MSTTVQVIAAAVNPVKEAALNPVFTGALLWALTKAPPSIRDQLLRPFVSLQHDVSLASLVKSLKWLFMLGVAGRANGVLNTWALNGWRVRLGSEKKRWDWGNEIAVVTGGCSGIGELTVRGLVKKGVKVAVLDIQPLPDSMKEWANVNYYKCDITNPSQVSEAAKAIREDIGEPSILVNNAGIGAAHTILETSPEFLQKIFGVNLFSNWYTVKEFLPDMIQKNKGHIVTIASMASYVSVAGIVDYSATKAAVLAFHEGLSQEIKHRYKTPSILTTSIHPNWVSTPMITTWKDSLKRSTVRLLTPNMVADAVCKQIFSCRGGQIILPRNNKLSTSIRGWPNWLQEPLRDGTHNSCI